MHLSSELLLGYWVFSSERFYNSNLYNINYLSWTAVTNDVTMYLYSYIRNRGIAMFKKINDHEESNVLDSICMCTMENWSCINSNLCGLNWVQYWTYVDSTCQEWLVDYACMCISALCTKIGVQLHTELVLHNIYTKGCC